MSAIFVVFVHHGTYASMEAAFSNASRELQLAVQKITLAEEENAILLHAKMENALEWRPNVSKTSAEYLVCVAKRRINAVVPLVLNAKKASVKMIK